MKVCIFFTLYFLSVYYNSVFSFKYDEIPPHYINPSDPNYDRVTKTIRKPKSSDDEPITSFKHEEDKPNRTYKNEILNVLMYYRRTVNMMLKLLELNEDSGAFKVQLKSKITQEQYDILKQFGSGKDIQYLEKLSMLDDAISELLTDTMEYEIFNRFLFGSFNFDIITVIICVMVFILCVYILLVKHSFRITGILMILLFFIFCVSYVWTFFNLVEDEEIYQITEQMKYQDFPDDCEPEKYSFWRLLGFSPGYKNSCLKYFRAHQKTSWKSVTPQRVIGEIFGQTFSTTFVHLGKAFINVISTLYDEIPFPWNILLMPLLLFTMIVFIAILLGYHIEFSILYNFIRFKFGNQTSASTIIYQSRIEDVQVKENKKIKQNKNNSTEDKFTKNKPVNENKPKITDENIETIKNSLEKSSGNSIQEDKKINNEKHEFDSSNDMIGNGNGDSISKYMPENTVNSHKKSSGNFIQEDKKINNEKHEFDSSNDMIQDGSGDSISKYILENTVNSHKKSSGNFIQEDKKINNEKHEFDSSNDMIQDGSGDSVTNVTKYMPEVTVNSHKKCE